MTNKEAATHFAAQPPNQLATVRLHHPDAAVLPVSNLLVLDEEDLQGCCEDYKECKGEVAVNTCP